MYLGCDLYAPCKRRSLRMVIVTGIHDPTDSCAGMNNPTLPVRAFFVTKRHPSSTLRQRIKKKREKWPERNNPLNSREIVRLSESSSATMTRITKCPVPQGDMDYQREEKNSRHISSYYIISSKILVTS